MAKRYTEEDYALELRQILVEDLGELQDSVEDFCGKGSMQPLIKECILVGPPTYQLMDIMLFIEPGTVSHPGRVLRAGTETGLDGEDYQVWARDVVGELALIPQARMAPDFAGIHAATRVVMRLTAAIDRIMLRYVGHAGWWPVQWNPTITPVEGFVAVGSGDTVAARRIPINIKMKEFVDTSPQV
jgi:hypothetical protein